MMAPVMGAFVLLGCGGDSSADDPMVARAYDQNLRWSDLRQVVPMDATPEDSAAIAEAYIQNWMRQQVELHQAELNLASSEKDFEAELRDYRNSLLLIAYEEALVDQRLDTSISTEEMERYYQANASAFDLQDDIVRARWFSVVEQDKRILKRMEERFLSGDADKMREVEIMLAEKGITITDHSNTWTSFADLRNAVPLEETPAVAPEGKRIIVRQDSTTWFIDMIELRPRHSASPIELVKQGIRTTILNQRKLHLIEQMRSDLFREATTSKDVEAY